MVVEVQKVVLGEKKVAVYMEMWCWVMEKVAMEVERWWFRSQSRWWRYESW